MYYQLNFKTGKYVVERLSEQPNGILIQIAAVLRHPKQGDLHHPKETDVFFHERKALAYQEKRIVNLNLLKPFDESVPPYNDSLKEAVEKLEQQLEQDDSVFNKKSLENIARLKLEYARYNKIDF